MNNIIRKAILPLALSFAALAGVSAQTTQPSSTAGASTQAATKTRAERRADAVEQQIKDLHAQLQITPAQAPQWEAYAKVMRDNAKKASQAFQERAQKMPTMNADEVMKSYARLAQMHADDMQTLSSAWSDLYATLSAEQKQAADELFRNMKPHHKGGHKKAGKPAAASSSASAPGT